MTNYKIFFVYENKESLVAFEKAFQKTSFPKLQFKKLLIKVISLEKFNNLKTDVSNIKIVHINEKMILNCSQLIEDLSEYFVNDKRVVYVPDYKDFTIKSKVVQYFHPEEIYQYLFSSTDYQKVKEDLLTLLNRKIKTQTASIQHYEDCLERGQKSLSILENAKSLIYP